MHLKKMKIICFFTIGLLVVGSIIPSISGRYLNITNTFTHPLNKKIDSFNYKMSFSTPEIIEQGKIKKVEIKEANSYITQVDETKLPFFTKTITFPLGTKIIDIQCIHSKPVSISFNNSIDIVSDIDKVPDYIFRLNQLENNQWYQCKTGGGIQNGKHVLFLTISFYPLKYKETKDKLFFVDNFEITINHIIFSTQTFENNEYDLLVISPTNFQSSLEELVIHKNNHGISTKLVTLNEIYQDTYFSVNGIDDAEDIKYFIYNAFNEWGIDYVLLVGNINKIPIRKTWMGTGENQRTPLTDLYYADLCFGDGSFCSWDSNDNGYYGEIWHGTQDDLVDLYADVYIGRLACNNVIEVNIAVDKILQYENNAFEKQWTNNFVMVGGDTHPSHNDYPEGEILINEIAEVTPTFNHVMLKTSENAFSHQSLNNAINDGAGFFCYAGHGFEIGLSTHPPNSEEWIDYNINHLLGLKNKDKLPIVFFNACLTARLDYNIVNLIADIIYFSSPLPKLNKQDDILFPLLFPCIAWAMIAQPNGGAVATIGATRVSYGGIDESGEVHGGCSYISLKFFEAISTSTYVSELLFSAENDFLNNATWKDPFVVEEMILLGDPTLKIGGYK